MRCGWRRREERHEDQRRDRDDRGGDQCRHGGRRPKRDSKRRTAQASYRRGEARLAALVAQQPPKRRERHHSACARPRRAHPGQISHCRHEVGARETCPVPVLRPTPVFTGFNRMNDQSWNTQEYAALPFLNTQGWSTHPSTRGSPRSFLLELRLGSRPRRKQSCLPCELLGELRQCR